MINFRLLLLAALVAGAMGGVATAQGVRSDDADRALEEIVVTAQKREQGLREVPISVSVVSGELINQLGVAELEDLSARMPAFTVTEAAISTLVFVRGLGSGINQGFEQSVGMYVDGVYAGRNRQFRSLFLDLERVELLRGPQGILFGKNTIAGAINITTAQPTDRLEGYLTGRFGEHGESHFTGVVSGPLSETVSGRLAARASGTDGYMHNTVTGRDEVDSDEEQLRLSLRWQPSDRLSLTGKFDRGEFDVRGRTTQIVEAGLFEPLYLAFDPAFEDRLNERKSVGGIGLDHSETETENATLTADYDFGEYVLTTIAGVSSYDYLDGLDVDFGPVPMLFQREPQSYDQRSLEIRLASDHAGRFTFVAGVYVEDGELDNRKNVDADLGALNVPLPPTTRIIDFDQDTDSRALFGQGTWGLGDDWRLSLGLRYTDEEKAASQRLFFADFQTVNPNPQLGFFYGQGGFGIEHAYRRKRSEDNISPSISLQWAPDERVNYYLSAARGFKAGGFNEAEVTGEIENFEFEDEESTTLEFGAKTRLAGGAARLDIAAFHTRFDDLQVSTFEGVDFVVGNAAEATSQGIELDGRYRLTEHWTIGGSWTYLDATFDSFPNAACTIEQTVASGLGFLCTQDLSGRVTQYAPTSSGRIDLGYRTTFGAGHELAVEGSVVHSDGYYVEQDLDRNAFQDAFQKLDLRIAWTSPDGDWSASLLGKNLTDELTFSHGSDVPLLPGAHYTTLDPPRSVALQVTWRF